MNDSKVENAVHIIGAGLAGCEAAWQCAQMGVPVVLHEMKKIRKSPAHSYDGFGELVCSNSLKGNAIENACGLLKEEMRILGSLIIECADETAVPAGGALAVDRDAFSDKITEKINSHPLIKVIDEEYTGEGLLSNNDTKIIIASGPLTDGVLYKNIQELIHADYLHFFDAAAPLVETDSIDMTVAFCASRYGKDAEVAGTASEGDYINCPMNEQQYLAFYNELISAQVADVNEFEKKKIFEGCMPVEIMAGRGVDTLRFGPLKPVGLDNPVTGEKYYAVVQLRQDNFQGSLYNMVGFQTRLKFGEQKRVFSMIPGLENAVFERHGVMHRNTFIDSPHLLNSVYKLKERDNIFFAGQITGVEGYVESASSGLIAGINAAREVLKKEPLVIENDTAIGALAQYISDHNVKHFQPMNINFGIIKGIDEKIRDKKTRYNKIAVRALEAVNDKTKILSEVL
jgi:methylenetetrahydrofolate--tRNA-(uracil-5-)-methyltransferase